MKIAFRTRISTIAFSILALTLALGVCVRAADAEKPLPLADILPEGTIMFADIRPWGDWSKDFSNTSLSKIFSEPEVRAFLAGPSNQISNMIRKAIQPKPVIGPVPPAAVDGAKINATAEAHANTPDLATSILDVLNDFTPGPLSFAVRYSAEDAQAKANPAFALLTGFRDERNLEAKKDVVVSLMDGMLKNWNVEAVKVTEYQNAKIISVTPIMTDGQRMNIVSVTMFKGRLIVGNELKLCMQIMDGLSGKLEKKLSDSATYKSCGLTGDEHLAAYIDFAGLQPAVNAGKVADNAQNRLDDYLALAGLNKNSAVAWSLKMNGEAFESRTAIFSSGERAGLLGTLDEEPLSADALKVCTASTPFAAGMRLRPDHVLPFLHNAIKSLQGEKGLSEFVSVEKELNIEQGLREAYGSEFVVTSLADLENTGPIGAVSAFVATLSVKDGKKADDLLARTLQHFAIKADPHGNAANILKESEYDGVKIRYLNMPPMAGVIKLSPAFALYQQRLVMALDVPTLKHAMRVIKEGGSLAESAPFKKALEQTGGKIGPMFNYVDWAQVYRSSFNSAAYAMKLLAPPAILEAVDVDINLLPDTETVAQHLFPSLSIARLTPNGIVMSSRSPLPSIEVLTPPLTAITAACESLRPFMMSTANQK